MPDVFFVGHMAYNGGSYLSSAISTSRISFSVNSSVDLSQGNWCSSCGVCWEYTIVVDSFYMGKTTEENAIAMCYCTDTLDDNQLLDKINLIRSSKGLSSFVSFASAMSWIRSEGIFITNQNYPSISTLNHVLLLDAGLTASYPNQGTNWYNMATSSNNATLNGAVSWDDNFRGSLNFDGSTGYASFASTSGIPTANSNYTISVWFNATTRTGTDGLVGWGGYGTNNAVNAIKLTSTGVENVWGGNDLSVTTTIDADTWYNVVATFDGTTRRLYLNGAQIGSDTPVGHNVTTSSNMTVGKTDTSEFFDGKISFVQILPDALSSDQVLSSYTNFNTRYDGTFTEICDLPVYCNTPTPTSTTPSPTPTPTPPPTPEIQGQCIEVTSNELGVIFLDYKRRDGVQACQPIGQGQTLPVCVYPGEGGNIESWDGFPCAGPNNLLPPSAISIVPMGLNCYNAGDCITETLNPIVLAWDESGYNYETGKAQFGCSLVRICVEANKT